MARPTTLLGVVAAVTALLVGCAPGPVANPNFVTDSGSGGGAQDAAAPPSDAPPALVAPGSDLSWSDCTSRSFGDAGTVAPVGVRLECASYDADLDPVDGASGTVTVGAVRATGARTPADAAPLVLTTGTDLPTSLMLPRWLSRSGADVLATRPIVAVDRRGMGSSGELDCRDSFDVLEMREQAQFLPGDDPVANLGEITLAATTSCTDLIAPGDSAYDNVRAAEDIEKLRTIWGVPAIALMGIGNGGQVAMAYAGRHPSKLARLIVDSPIAPGIGAEAAAEQQVQGQQAAFDAFVDQCASLPDCPLGADPRGAVDALLADARAGDGPGGLSTAAVTNALIVALGFPSGDRVGTTAALAGALAAARRGDDNALNSLVNEVDALRETDGQFVNGCSDALNRPTPDRVRELVVAWGRAYPQFGTVAALDMVKCLNWPSATAPPTPADLPVDVLLLGVAHDPIAGSQGVAAVAGTVINAGVTSRRVVWQGTGHGAAVYASCATPVVVGYLDSGELPPTDTYCPA